MSTDQRRDLGRTLWSPDKRAVVALIAWLGLLALGSAFVSTPFQAGSGNAVNYGNIMYLHGILVGLTGLVALIVLDVLDAAGKGGALRGIVLYGTLLAALLTGIGGIFDTSAQATFPLWLQIIGFLCLDVVLAALTLGLFLRAAYVKRIWSFAAAFASCSAFVAALMGSVGAWMLAFGDWPTRLIGGYAKLIGLPWHTWMNYLVAAHGQEMGVAVIALVSATACAALGLERKGNRTLNTGLYLATAGIIALMVLSLVGGFSAAQPPIVFQHGPDGLNGIAADSLLIGVVVLGTAIALLGLGLERLPDAAHRWGAAVIGAAILLTLVGVGFFISLNQSLYGMGAVTAPRAAAYAAFTWFHQDFALYLLPGVLAVMIAARRLGQNERLRRTGDLTLLVGVVISFVAGLLYVFVAPAVYGLSFVVATIGIACVVIGVVLSLLAIYGPGHPIAQSVAPSSRTASAAAKPGKPSEQRSAATALR